MTKDSRFFVVLKLHNLFYFNEPDTHLNNVENLIRHFIPDILNATIYDYNTALLVHDYIQTNFTYSSSSFMIMNIKDTNYLQLERAEKLKEILC